MRFLAKVAAVVAAGFVGYATLPMIWADVPQAREPWEGPALAKLPHEVFGVQNGEIELAGLVFAPEEVRAVVTVIHGSGPSRRDHGWYTRLADYLMGEGIALVLPDKRGSEQSGGNWRTASMQELAGDAAAVFDYADARWPDVPVGVLGASQGGWIAPILATMRPDLDFVIDQSGAAVPAREQLVFEEANTLVEMGMPRPAAQIVAPVSAWSIRAWRQKGTWDAIGDFDPVQYWQNVPQPALVIYGALDEFDNVPVARSVARLKALELENLDVRVIDGVGHSMNAPGSGDISLDFLEAVAGFALPKG